MRPIALVLARALLERLVAYRQRRFQLVDRTRRRCQRGASHGCSG